MGSAAGGRTWEGSGVTTAEDARPILVTGAGGFIGSAAVRFLVAAGLPVRAHLGPPGIEASAPAGVQALVAELEDLAAMRSAVEGARAVVHLAGPASVAASFDDPVGFARVHVAGTATLLEACRGRDVDRLVHVSSAEVYAPSEGGPVSEDDPLRPRSPYGAAKLGAESLVRSLAPLLGTEAVVLRPFSVYGPGGPRRSVVGTVLDQALHADRIELADLRPVRDHCYVDDVAGAILRALVARSLPPDAVLNVGTGRGVSVAELAELGLAAAGRSLEVGAGTADRPAGIDVPALVADVARAERDLGWRAQVPLEEGLSRTVAWMRSEEVGDR